MVLAMFNIYYVRVLYHDLQDIMFTMESMHGHLRNVDDDMQVVTRRIGRFDKHLTNMEPIQSNMRSLSETLPNLSVNMHEIAGKIGLIEVDMGLISQGMGVIDQRLHVMTGGVGVMRHNVRQMSGPMGAMNPMMP